MSETGLIELGCVLERATLSATALFEGLPAESLQALEDNSVVRTVRRGYVFFKSGQHGEVLYLLEKGAVQTFRMSGKKKLVVADVSPNSIFGEMGCVGQCIYHCSAEAVKPSRIRIISRSDLNALLEQHPRLTRRLLDLLSERFIRVLKDLESTSFRQLIPRLAALLLERADGDSIRDLTHKEIADHLHVYRESATAALGELRKAGIIEIRRKQIRFLDRARLERAARE